MALVLDYAGRPPRASVVRQSGYSGAVRYIAPDRTGGKLPGKPIWGNEVRDYDSQSLELAFVWQYGKDGSSVVPPDTSRGYAGGVADARAADAHLRSIGRAGWPVFFAVDYDMSPWQWKNSGLPYFQACVRTLGLDRVGIYGHNRVIDWAVADNVVAPLGYNRRLAWQTVAWSNGQRTPHAVLFQRRGTTYVDGTACDINDVLHPYWGQRPNPASAGALTIPNIPGLGSGSAGPIVDFVQSILRRM